eukprot:TRINITY_DN1751_c0_g1_i1.p1 TRINITY_DN1751_c0_g1~~TRINITY_DN1751_c0_g1_i1.p1  ORF type:complete len:533 (+),score=131.45 TRINITY_DN1751_c0_g1_i1:62-1600(+)
MALTVSRYPFLAELGIHENNPGCFNGTWCGSGETIVSLNPTTNEPIANVQGATVEEYESCIASMDKAKKFWQLMPAPKRGDIVRQIGQELRKKHNALAALISLEMGKILAEGMGEVQEFIDMCDFAVGLSRQINGSVIPSERPNHVILERWNPLGHIGVITAFNFPVAVLGWNACLALICGDTIVWKGASSTSLCTVAVTKIIADVLARNALPHGIFTTCQGSGKTVGERLIQDERLKLISFTGSTSIGRRVSAAVHSRFGRTILELGGNNGIVVMSDADLDLALNATLFGSVGTAGQRCTTTRRLFLHESIHDTFVSRLLGAYKQVKIGNPLESGVLCGPLHTKAAVKEYLDGIAEIKKQGGVVLTGGERVPNTTGNFVYPTIVSIRHDAEIINTELFVPILYIIKFSTFEQAIEWHNSVPQGLSSALFSRSQQLMWQWIGATGSDCGLVNVNIGTSGAEIGGAFGGEKETGNGREAGSDSWKQYMRQSTCTINYSNELPLAQGLNFSASA